MSQASISHAGTAKPLSLGNRRAIIRYRCAPAMIGKVFTAGDQEMQRAWILDLSIRGIGMQVTRALEPRSLIVVSMRSNDGAKVYEITANVTHCRALHHGEFHVGGELTIPLTPEELDHLL